MSARISSKKHLRNKITKNPLTPKKNQHQNSKRTIHNSPKQILPIISTKFMLRKRITNIVGGNMKNVEEYAQDYAQDYAEDKLNKYTEKIIINLKNKGFTINEIIETLNVSKDFVEKTLAK